MERHDYRQILSKSRFILGLKCHKALWLNCHKPELAEKPTATEQGRFDEGSEVGKLAQQMYPNGLFIEDRDLQVALTETKTAIAKGVLVFEAAFFLKRLSLQVRADILIPLDKGLADLVKVKSSTKLKEQHLDDLAIQAIAMESPQFRLRGIYLMHLNKSYCHKGGSYKLKQLFNIVDCTEEVRNRLNSAKKEAQNLIQVVNSEKEPEIETGSQCQKPYKCPFYGYCHEQRA